MVRSLVFTSKVSFNTQPPKGGWGRAMYYGISTVIVSTHSRLKAAGIHQVLHSYKQNVSTHSRLKAAGPYPNTYRHYDHVSTHSRLKAAGTKSAPPRRDAAKFQHTAA